MGVAMSLFINYLLPRERLEPWVEKFKTKFHRNK